MNDNFWERNAEAWTQAVQNRLIASRAITSPVLIAEILRDQPDNVLDVGCGEGWLASELALLKIKYTGLDASERLIQAARKHCPAGNFERVGYEAVITGQWCPHRLFDKAIFNFSLFDEDPRPLLKKVASYLKPSGTLIIQTLHPFSLDPYQDGWNTEKFESFPVQFVGSLPWFGRTFGSWMTVLTESGFQLSQVQEPSDPVSRIPLSLVLSARRACSKSARISG